MADDLPKNVHSGYKVLPGSLSKQSENSALGLSDYATCEDVDGSYNPVNIKDTFYSTDTYVCSWVKFVDESAEFSVKWEFYKPDGGLYYTGTINVTGTPPWSEVRVAYKIGINGSSASNYEGQWTIKIYKGEGQIITDNFELVVYCDSPTAAFSASPTSGCAPITVNFSDMSSQNGGTCSIISWDWNFGDGTGSGQYPSHTYNTPGTYTVSLQVTNNKEGTDTEIKESYIVVADCRPGYISGQKFVDKNGNHEKDMGDDGIANWKIMLSNGDYTYTDYSGIYSFEVDPGTYSVSEESKFGYTQTFPTTPWSNLVVGPNQAIEGIDFGNYPEKASISGKKFNDRNEDGAYSNGEEGLEGWTIELDNGQSTVTGSNGQYSFEVDAGIYYVSEVLQTDWVQSYPDDGWLITVGPGEVAEAMDFGNYLPRGTIMGRKFKDINQNSTFDIGEVGLEGWTIQLNTGETTTTDEDGLYSFYVEPGNYLVTEVLENNWVQTYPLEQWNIEISPGGIYEEVNFGNYPLPGGIIGMKFLDENRNGEYDILEKGLEGWTIILDGYDTTITDSNGIYTFSNVSAEQHSVEEVLQDNWIQTLPSGNLWLFNVPAGRYIEDINFGNYPKDGGISGTKYLDVNRNGEIDIGDTPLQGWTIQLDGEETTITDENGHYYFEVESGMHYVDEVLKDNWIRVYPVLPWVEFVEPGQVLENYNFLNYPKDGGISGKKFIDANANGQYDDGEPGDSGWTIILDNGMSEITDENGHYYFVVEPGEYKVTEVLPLPIPIPFQGQWINSYPPSGEHNVTVNPGQIIEAVNFGNYRDEGEIRGQKFLDDNRNGIKDSSEVGLQGWQIKLSDGQTTTTGADGTYSFSVTTGDYTVSEVLQDNWIQSYPENTWSVTVLPEQIVEEIDFGNYPEDGEISGFKFHDINNNTFWDNGEPGLFGVEITLSNGASVITDIVGSYKFTVKPGAYLVGEILPAGWRVTTPLAGMHLITVSPGEKIEDVNFGNIEIDIEDGGISGKKFHDLNKNGKYDDGEPGLPDWEININGITIKTDSSGHYYVTVEPGDYTVTETLKSGWINSYPASGKYDVTVVSGQVVEGVDFGNYPKDGGITGQKFMDLDGDGNWDDGEPVLPGWTIKLNTGAIAVTDINGSYYFVVPPGTYTVSEVLQAGWTQSHPKPVPPGTHTVVVTPGDVVEGRDFGNIPPGGIIGGDKFFDEDEDGLYDENEFPLNGFVIELYDESRNILAVDTTGGDKTTETDSSDIANHHGKFKFDGLIPGIYYVQEQIPEGWIQTVPENNEYEVELTPGDNIDDLIFGNISYHLDWGDLPDTAQNSQPHPPWFPWQWYPTLKPNGAAHGTYGAYLGDKRDSEGNGQPTVFADGDDDNGQDDEDGVQYLSWIPSVSGEVAVTVNGQPNDFPVWLTAWIDFNDDGYLEYPFVLPFILIPDEMIIFSSIPKAGTYRYTFPIPTDNYGPGYARFRVCTNFWTAMFPWGIAIDGEVEDYVGVGFDYGDANNDIDPTNNIYPYGYPVKLVDDGARHLPTPLVKLGPALTDADIDGQPTKHATGDDYNNRDDEDGIQWESGYSQVFNGSDPLLGSQNLSIVGFSKGNAISFKPLASRTGYLYAWIDYNRDGDWDDSGENIFNNEFIKPAPDYTLLTFTVPNNISIGWTYMRFRFVTDHNAGVKVTGIERDGEVEDYLVMLLPELDFSDSPFPYPTLISEYGAKHYLSSYYLGENIDAESDGIHDNQALGDDKNNLDDEDGISFMNSFSAGKELHLTVYSNVPAGGSGYLNAWIDYDKDGSWDTNSERMISDKVLYGGLDTLIFMVQNTATSGSTYIRFRFSSQPGLDPYDSTPFNGTFLIDGEVEDYIVSIDSGSTAIDVFGDYKPDRFELYQNHPNPFNSTTVISFDILHITPVILNIYNVLGQQVFTVVNEMKEVGQYHVQVNMNENPAGLYFYSIKMGDYVSTKKMLYLK